VRRTQLHKAPLLWFDMTYPSATLHTAERPLTAHRKRVAGVPAACSARPR
jgi:hypothetical protein